MQRLEAKTIILFSLPIIMFLLLTIVTFTGIVSNG